MFAIAGINRKNKRGWTGVNVVSLAVSTAVAVARASEMRKASGLPAARQVTKRMVGTANGRG